MQFSKLLQIKEPLRPTNRTILYLTVALVAQVLFWYFSMPGPQLASDFVANFDGGAISCFVAAGCLLVAPLVCIVVMRDDVKRFGFGFGDFKYGILAVLVVAPIFVTATLLGSGDPHVIAFYPIPGEEIGKDANNFLLWTLCYACFYISFEFFYRGFLLFGADDLGITYCFMIQLGCCVLIHAGKPFSETLASIPASILFAWITIRSRSFLYAFLIHWLVGITNDLAALWQRDALEFGPF